MFLKSNNKKNRYARSKAIKSGAGFTLMEIVVATTIFAFVLTSMMALFNYTLKINRRTEALRQATQGMRNFVEFLVKEIRNGQIDYSVSFDDHDTAVDPILPCPRPQNDSVSGVPTSGNNSYSQLRDDGRDNRLGIYNERGERECFYLANSSGAWVGLDVYAGNKLMLKKENVATAEELNPLNFNVQELSFFIAPQKDPYVCTGGLALQQPFVIIAMKILVELPTKEQTLLYYQTSVSTNKYDIPKTCS
jgi:type II secretory pathway pseudopilin PulG